MSSVIIHYHEIGLKGKNRSFFERVLQANVAAALTGIPHDPPRRLHGRLEVPLKDATRVETVKERLARVFGITSFSVASVTVCDMQAIQQAAWELLRRESFVSFAIRARRSEKTYPFTSQDVQAAVGAYVQQHCPARVDLTHPDIQCHIEMVQGRCFVYLHRYAGPGGLPVGVSGRILCLISGGIDSPVAAYRLMRRGAHIVFIHFHGVPFTDRSSQNMVRELVQRLTLYQMRSKLYLLPFGEIQRQVSLQSDPAYRIILYRRLMFKIAEVAAKREKCLALGTGESLGQVASQTLQNLASIDAAATLPVLRPLIGDDKMEIVAAARRIGTYEVSTTPHVEDCCPMFMPQQPVTRSRLKDVLEAESTLDVEALVAQGITGATVETLAAPWLCDG